MKMINERGLTLVELVLSVVVIGIIAIIAAEAFLGSARSVLTGDSVREATQVNRLALDRIIREIRNVRNNRCVATATASTISFVDGLNNTITYSWAGASGDPLLRTENAVTNTLVESVDNLVLTYYNNGDPPVPIPVPTVCGAPNTCLTTVCAVTNIWFVGIDLTTLSGGETVKLRSQVFPSSF